MDFVSVPIIEMLLLVIMFLSLFIEIKTGGMGAGILLGIVAAGVFWGSQYIKGLVDLYQIAIFFVGIICIGVEILLPTVGLLAGIGVAAMLYSIVLALGGDINALYAMLISLAVAILIFIVILKRLPSSRLWNKLVLKDSTSDEKGFVSAAEHKNLIGKEGVVLSDLRPAGTALIDKIPVDVVSEGRFISKGTTIIVIAAFGSRVVVREK